MTEHECDFPDTCPVCLGPAPKPVVEWSHPFTAKYDGDCPGCGLPIAAGQRIVTDGTRYVHLGHEL